MVYKHTKSTIACIDTFRSNAFRLKKGAIHDSIKLNYLADSGVMEEKIDNFEYDVESRVLYLPDYEANPSKDRRVLIKYDREVDNGFKLANGFSDISFFKIDEE